MHNLSCKNEFYLHENEKSFPYQRLSTYPRFETEAGGTRKWPIEPFPVARVRDSLARRLYHSDWFVAVDLLIFHILMIPNKDAPGSRDSCLPHSPPQCLRVCAEELRGRDCCVPTLANARACVRNWPGRGLVYVCQLLLRLLFWPFPVMGWFKSHNGIHRNNGAIACDTRAQFWSGRRAKNKQTNGVGHYLHGTWINSIFCHYFQENLKQRRFSKRRSSTGSGLFALLSRDFEQILGQIVSLREKTLNNRNLVVPWHNKKEKDLLLVDERCSKRSLLKLPVDF